MERGRSQSILLLRAATAAPRLEQIEVDGLAHRQISGAIGVKLVAGAAGGAFGNELRLEATGLWIKLRLVEIDHAVEGAGCADELDEGFALGVLLGEASRRDGADDR